MLCFGEKNEPMVIDCEAREMICLVASVRPSVSDYQSVCLSIMSISSATSI